jgi:aspartate racemase
MSKRIGILGGISHESTAEYYLAIHRRYHALRGDAYYPEVVVFSLDFQRFTDLEDAGDRDGYVAYILEGIRSLEAAGVDFIAMAANSPHAVFDEVSRRARVPLISLVQVTADAAHRAGLRTLLLLAIGFTVRSGVYQRAGEELGMRVVAPTEREQAEIDRVIFRELTVGIQRAAGRQTLLDVIARYDVDGVILGCTELPLVIRPGDVDPEVLDTIELHVQAILDKALE